MILLIILVIGQLAIGLAIGYLATNCGVRNAFDSLWSRLKRNG